MDSRGCTAPCVACGFYHNGPCWNSWQWPTWQWGQLIQYGWKCPECGGVYAPALMYCLKCTTLKPEEPADASD